MPSDERQAISVTGATSPVGGNYLNWLAARGITRTGLTDSGIIVDVADTGVDVGCMTTGHLDLDGRRMYHRAFGTLSAATGDDLHHGTLVAGIIAGNPVDGKNSAGGATNGFGMKDSDSYGQFYYGLGVAPGIRIGSTKMTGTNNHQGTVAEWTTNAVTPLCGTPTNVCAQSVECRATVQNHSHNEYAFANAGYYSARSREFDISVRNADRSYPGRPLTITMSAGNYRQGADQTSTKVMAAATAKNVISVGATESMRDALSACTSDGTVENPSVRHSAQGYNALAYVSRRGTNDSRIKPDLVAPATLAAGPRTATQAVAAYCLIGGDSSQWLWPQYQGSSGTSFAAPVAAGSVAILRQYYGSMNGNSGPSPAMFKAMLVAASRSITGGTDRLTGGSVTWWPGEQQGFGLISLGELLSSSANKDWHDQATVLLQGEEYVRTITVVDPTKPVRISVAYTDKEAAMGASVTLVNDLHLKVEFDDFPYRYSGNVTDANGWSRKANLCSLTNPSACVATNDIRNNVEVLNINPSLFANTLMRTFRVHVRARQLNGVGVPGVSGGAYNQDFALFIVNGKFQ